MVSTWLRALRLTTAAKKLLECWPDQFLPYLSGSTETNVLKSEVPRRLRLHRMAEVLVTMLNAGVSGFPWEKPDIFNPKPPAAAPYINRPAYYSSREVKDLGAQAVKIRGSCSAGLLLTDDAIFTVYNAGPHFNFLKHLLCGFNPTSQAIVRAEPSALHQSPPTAVSLPASPTCSTPEPEALTWAIKWY